jgi:ectoine hydroxylase-related dioxygenase (phytanoyl-CoA dioxygenase family)
MSYHSDFYANGFLPAVDIFNSDESNKLRDDLNITIDQYDILNTEYRCKSHMLFKWVDELVHHPKILKIVKELLGENIICHDTMFWCKQPQCDQYVSFHQDGYYWNVKEPVKGVTVWVPFQDTDDINGTIHYVDNSHTTFHTHIDITNSSNMLKRGQTIDVEQLALPIKSCPTKLGQVTMHHPYNVHGSYPNHSDSARIACNIQYVASNIEILINNNTEYGVLVSGVNNTNMKIVNRPNNNFEENYKVWYQAWYNQRQNYLLHKGR